MEGSKTLADMGFTPVRHRTSGGNFKPHFSLSFGSQGERKTFGVDTTRNGKKDDQYFLITHAHTDHYGKSAMLSDRAIASDKTAVTLEMRHDQHYKGKTFKVGETVDVDGVQVRTYYTHHSIGATAFFWENDQGVKVLVTGDVKDFSGLPKCDLLVTEATYGDPGDMNCIFKDDLDSFETALTHKRVAFGAYAFGKAQRAVTMARQFGFDDTIAMDHNSYILTRLLLGDEAGDIVSLKKEASRNDQPHRLSVTSPWTLDSLPFGIKKFVLTGQKHYAHPTICISDHLDFNGLRDMVFHCDPEFTLVYHPDGGSNATAFSDFLRRNGKSSCTLTDLSGSPDMPF